MKKLLLPLLLLSTNASATCSAIAETWNQGAQQNILSPVYSHHQYTITNESNVRQTYSVCTEISTQLYDHTQKQANTQCHELSLLPGQTTGNVVSNPNVLVKYNGASLDYWASIDAVTDIHGPCSTIAHTIKRLKVYR